MNPFFNPGGVASNPNVMTKENAVSLMMKQAFNMGTDNFIKQIINRNPQAQMIYKSMMQSGDPKQFYFNMMQMNGMNKEQAVEFARNNGIKL